MSRTAEAAARLRAHADTIERLELPLDEVPEGHEWTRARILRHVVMSLVPYLQATENTVHRLKSGPQERQSWVGEKLEKVAGPNFNAPVPSKLKPAPTPTDPTVVKEFVEAHRKLAELADLADKGDARASAIPVPLFPLVHVTPLDVFLFQVAHADRHVAQVLRPGHSSRTQD
ncbi:hypothetical protein BH11ARM2_BH11ARM2_11280 [soil metagenome]